MHESNIPKVNDLYGVRAYLSQLIQDLTRLGCERFHPDQGQHLGEMPNVEPILRLLPSDLIKLAFYRTDEGQHVNLTQNLDIDSLQHTLIQGYDYKITGLGFSLRATTKTLTQKSDWGVQLACIHPQTENGISTPLMFLTPQICLINKIQTKI